jgi:hypothetical protein
MALDFVMPPLRGSGQGTGRASVGDPPKADDHGINRGVRESAEGGLAPADFG